MSEGLAEADAGIDGDPAARDAGCLTSGDPLCEHVEDIERHVLIDGVVLHGLGVALRMHQDDWATEARHDSKAFAIETEGRDIIDDGSARRDGVAHQGCLARVDRDTMTVSRPS